jgi:hypothetical protein
MARQDRQGQAKDRLIYCKCRASSPGLELTNNAAISKSPDIPCPQDTPIDEPDISPLSLIIKRHPCIPTTPTRTPPGPLAIPPTAAPLSAPHSDQHHETPSHYLHPTAPLFPLAPPKTKILLYSSTAQSVNPVRAAVAGRMRE